MFKIIKKQILLIFILHGITLFSSIASTNLSKNKHTENPEKIALSSSNKNLTYKEKLRKIIQSKRARTAIEFTAKVATVAIIVAAAYGLYTLSRSTIVTPEITLAVKDKDLNKVKELYNKDTTIINKLDFYGWSPLHYAVLKDEKILDFLIEKNANLDIQNQHGQTPLHIAVTNKKLSIVKKLIENGADLTISNNSGYTVAEVAFNLNLMNIKTAIVEGNKNKYNEKSVFDLDKIKYLKKEEKKKKKKNKNK